MSNEIRSICLGAAALAASLAAVAQTAAPPAAQPAAGGYSSAFEGYRPFTADEVGDWRKANETVREIGGWRAYAREIQGESQSAAQPGGAAAQQPAQAPSSSAAPAAGPPAGVRPADPHQGHHR